MVVLRLCLVLCLLASPAFADKVALVIGNARYESAGALPNAGKDAGAMAARLEALGFRVFAGQDLTREGMLALLDDFSDALRPEDLALFYYAGHGVQIGAENYLIPVDAQANDEVTLTAASLRLQVVLRTMELRADRRIVILDACRNNPFLEEMAARGRDEAPKGLARVEAGVGSFIAFSTQPENVALDGTGENSPFTAALLAHIGDPEADIHAMMRRVRADVVAATGGVQVPWENSSLVEEVFVAAGAPVAEPEPEVAAQAAPADEGSALDRLAAALPRGAGEVPGVFDPGQGGAACYLRRYSAQHLRDHPEQRVAAMALGLVAMEGADAVLSLGVRLRGGARYEGSAYCAQDGEGLDCLMEGDAGRFSLTPGKKGALRLAVGARGISFEGADGFVTLEGTSGDDRVFLLPPLGPAECRRLAAALEGE